MFADFVAIARVIYHDEQNSFFAEQFILGVALAPFFNPQRQVVLVSLAEDRALLLVKFVATGSIRKNRMLNNILMNSFDQRIVSYGLNKNRTIVMPRSRRHVHLQR